MKRPILLIKYCVEDKDFDFKNSIPFMFRTKKDAKEYLKVFPKKKYPNTEVRMIKILIF